MRAVQGRLALGQLVGQQDAAANLQRVLNRFQSRSHRLPFIVTEIGMRRSGSDDQVVIAQLEVVQLNLVTLKIETRTSPSQHFDIFMTAQNLANGAAISAGEMPAVAT